jgi:hypothetical protein
MQWFSHNNWIKEPGQATALGIAAAMYVISWVIHPGSSRYLMGAVGVMRLLGYAGAILGIAVLFRKPKDAPKPPPPPQP